MAIGFARVEFVKRSAGKTACIKSAYNSRSELKFQGNKYLKEANYQWQSKEPVAFHEIQIPSHVNQKFKDPTTLWNAVEAKETRVNSQVAIDIVLALPDDATITLEDRIDLARRFVKKHLVDHGLAAQIDIHAPEKRIIFTKANKELGIQSKSSGQVIAKSENEITVKLESGEEKTFNPKEYTGYIEKEHNWHAHILATTRRFTMDGSDLGEKARDLMPKIIRGKVVSGLNWGNLWTQLQNQFFEEKGIAIQVDSKGIVPQVHLGPVRMRGRSFDILQEHAAIVEENNRSIHDPNKILKKLTENKSIFTKQDFENFVSKHVSPESLEAVSHSFWKNPKLVELTLGSGEKVNKFTSEDVLQEERQAIRLADGIHEKAAFSTQSNGTNGYQLNHEQKVAFDRILLGRKLSLIQGFAGTGKSQLLKALHDIYSEQKYFVRSLGPDNATARVLEGKGLSNTENIYSFLFSIHSGKKSIRKEKEVWIVDEAAKLGNKPLVELLKAAKNHGAQLILSGDSSQLPPIERGSLFEAISERYGAEQLQEIRRQVKEEDREIAKKLATGQFGQALDRLAAMNHIRWAKDGKEAMEEIAKSWDRETRFGNGAEVLVIAHSNRDVLALNELIRSVRKQRGELQGKEFQCETFLGKICVCIGDKIEFRKNDKELGITNGTRGTLIEAKEDSFIVSLGKSGKTEQLISFNPQKYHSYQLGYATTHFRSQGMTVDKAYVLHSRDMRKETFYVGLTRHVKEVLLFVSQQEAKSMADLKRQAIRSSKKETTLAYTTQETIDLEAKKQRTKGEIAALKAERSLFAKAKGYGMDAWSRLSETTSRLKETIEDKTPSREFFNPHIDESRKRAVVTEITTPMGQNPVYRAQNAVERPALSVEPVKILRNNKGLSEKQKLCFDNYMSGVQKASTLRFIVEQEADNHDLKKSPHYQEWQQMCGSRNELAHQVVQAFMGLKDRFSSKGWALLQEQSQKHELALARRDALGKGSIEEQLKEHVEPLLQKLFPDGFTSKDRTSLRFGRNGSISVVLSGEKRGQYFDYENQEGGGILRLVQKQLGFGKEEAFQWAKEFLGNESNLSVAPTYRAQIPEVEKRVWISQKPPNEKAPSIEEIRGGSLASYFKEESRHAYRDSQGDLLFYVLRLRDRHDPTRKITPPLSFGYWKEGSNQSQWELKGVGDNRGLYNLDLLHKKRGLPVLVVEGEKTADKAGELFPGYVVTTWMGGSGATKKTDWSSLAGRDVVIWPDNDAAGTKAGLQICSELRAFGVSSLKMVNPKSLQKSFPEKWDLADALPEGMNKASLEKLVALAPHKAIDPNKLLQRMGLSAADALLKVRVNEILRLVDERNRPTLEGAFGDNQTKIQEAVLQKSSEIIQKGSWGKNSGGFETLETRVSFQTSVWEAQKGTEPTLNEKNMIQEEVQLQKNQFLKNDPLSIIATDRAVAAKVTLLQNQKEVSRPTQVIDRGMDKRGLELN